MNDIERIADLCLNHQPPYIARLDKIADQIRILELEVELLSQRLDAAEKQNQQYKNAIEAL
jgi:TolA-binding protein